MPNPVLIAHLNKIKADYAHLSKEKLRIKLYEAQAEYVRWMLNTAK